MSQRSAHTTSLRRRGGFALAAGACAAALAVSACSSSGTGTTGGGASASVKPSTSGSIVWSASPLTGTGANDARTVLIKAFEKQYPNIKVSLVSAPTDTDTNRATLATEISGGSSTPDVFMGDVVWPAQFGAHQLAVPLSSVLPKSYWSKFAPGLVQGATYKGQVYGSPLFEDQGFLYYRKDLRPRSTWPCRRPGSSSRPLDQAGPRRPVKYGFVWEGDAYEGLTCNFAEFLADAGGAPTNAGYTKATLNSAAATKAITFMRGLITSGASPAAVSTFQEPQAMNTFGGGNAAFLRNWDYAYSAATTASSGGKLRPARSAWLRCPPSRASPPRLLQHRRLEHVHQPAQQEHGRRRDVHRVAVQPRRPGHPVPAVRIHLHRHLGAGLGRGHRLEPGFAVVPKTKLTPRPAGTPEYPQLSTAIYQNVNGALAGSASPAAAASAMQSAASSALSIRPTAACNQLAVAAGAGRQRFRLRPPSPLTRPGHEEVTR